MASFVYNEGAKQLTSAGISWTADTIKARLIPTSVTPNKDDASMTGYTSLQDSGALTTKTLTKDLTNDRIVFDADDVTFTAVAGGSTANGVVIYKDGANDAARIPIAFCDMTDTATNGGDIATPFDALGVFYLQE
jgi:hypothetical protein